MPEQPRGNAWLQAAPQAVRRSPRGRTPALPSLTLASAAAVCLSAACQRAPDLAYNVAIAEANPERLEVSLALDGVRGSALVLRGFAAKEVLRISDFRAASADGSPVAFEAGLEQTTLNSRTIDVPTFTLRGPLPASLQVRYAVQPGSREGDSHTGFTGRCYGYAGREFAFVTGRNLFLLPQPAERLSRITVRFALPPGWAAVAPWRKVGEMWRPGLEEGMAAEHLVTAAVSLGRFEERDFEVGGTRFRLSFVEGTPQHEQEQTAARLERVARYLRDLFGRDMGPEYLTAVWPKAPTGDDVAGEGWATGQGETLTPLTGSRLKVFAERLIEVYTRHAPYRTEIRSPEEFWLVDAVKTRYAWLAVAEAGLITQGEVDRSLAVNYLSTLGVHGLEPNLEKMYSGGAGMSLLRDVLAPFHLMLLDHELREATRGAVFFDALLKRLYRGRKAESLWSVLPAVKPGFWEQFRSRYVQAREIAPVKYFYDLRPTRPGPDPPAGAAVREVALAYTGETTGYLENCGCKTNQSGGVARRATVLERLRQRHKELLVLDAGDSFLRPKVQSELDFLSRHEQTLYLRTMDMMRYDAAAVGVTELFFGSRHFLEHTRGLKTPYLSANVLAGGKPISAPSLRLAAGRLRVAVIGVLEPPRGSSAQRLFEEHTLDLEIEDPVETLRREVPILARGADLVIALGRITPFTIRRIVEAAPDLDVVISSDFQAPVPSGEGDGHVHNEDQEGFLGRTLVLYTSLTNYGLGSVRIGVDAAGRVASASFEDHWLNEAIPDHPLLRTALNQFYDRVGRMAAAQESVQPLFADDPLRTSGRYVGGAVCAGCHEAEHQQWMTTSHASAFKTLLDRHRHFQPKCVSCHVVGYGTPHGYRLGAPEQTLANVQCEVCHGPGAAHVENPLPANIQRQVPEKVCLECHNPEHSDHFVYAERLPKVRHDYFEDGLGPQTHDDHASSAGGGGAP